MKPVYIVGGGRTPIGKTGGLLKQFLPEQLAAHVLNHILAKYNLTPAQIGQVILGNAVGPGGNIARVSVLSAGWPFHIPATTVDLQCGSGLAAVQWGAALLAADQAELVIVGGTESTSLQPKRQFAAADPRFISPEHYFDRAPFSPPDIGDPDIVAAAEALTNTAHFSRTELDNWALSSHQKAVQAKQQGLLQDIIVPLPGGELPLTADECIRANLSPALLARMKPLCPDGSMITAGNTCLKHDGAAAVLLATADAVKKYNLQPKARIISFGLSGCDPQQFPLSPVPALQQAAAKAGCALTDLAALEINEAFAVKVLACCQSLDFPLAKTNLLGGALAYGHPYGASGGIILLHLLQALTATGGRLGAAAIGAVGGMGTALLVETCEAL